MWLASFEQPSAVHGEVGKSATSVRLRAPAGRFDAAKGESISFSCLNCELSVLCAWFLITSVRDNDI